MNKQMNGSFEFNKAIDGQFLKELFEDDPSYAIVVFNGFLEEMPGCFDDMQTAFDNNDFKGLKSAAHKGKTLCAYVGLTAVSTQLQALETACGLPEDMPAIRSLFLNLVKERNATETLITEEIKRLEAFYEK
jgi:HPt (histidine-containing phosphotransfer) domain-containing protein